MPEPPSICKQIDYTIKDHADAEPALRRWDLIALQLFRLIGLGCLLALWFYIEYQTTFGVRPLGGSFGQFLKPLAAYLIFIPLILYLGFRNRARRRQAWLTAMQTAGTKETVYTSDGIRRLSENADVFIRWIAVKRLSNRRRTFVLHLTRAMAAIVPKGQLTAEEQQQILAWAAAPAPHQSPAPAAATFTFNGRGGYREYSEQVRLEKNRAHGLSLLLMRFAAFASVITMFLALMVVQNLHPLHFGAPKARLWSQLGFPLFLLAVYAWTYSFFVILRWAAWRDHRDYFQLVRRIEIDDNGLRSFDDAADMRFHWLAFDRVMEGKRVILLGIRGGAALSLPLRSIPEEVREALITFLHARIIPPTGGFPVQLPVSAA